MEWWFWIQVVESLWWKSEGLSTRQRESRMGKVRERATGIRGAGGMEKDWKGGEKLWGIKAYREYVICTYAKARSFVRNRDGRIDELFSGRGFCLFYGEFQGLPFRIVKALKYILPHSISISLFLFLVSLSIPHPSSDCTRIWELYGFAFRPPKLSHNLVGFSTSTVSFYSPNYCISQASIFKPAPIPPAAIGTWDYHQCNMYI